MKIFRASLMAEFRQTLPFLPWLLAAHALNYGLRTRWAEGFSDQLNGMVEWTTWALAALVAIVSLWRDAPLRRERFLATRPECFSAMLLAKIAALALVSTLPFAVVDFLALRTLGIGGRFLFLGTLQTALFFLAGLAALFPAVWWWRTACSAFTAAGVTFAALVGAAFLLSRQTGNLYLSSAASSGFPLNPLLAFGFFLTLAITSAVLLPWIKQARNGIRIPAFAVLASGSLWCGLEISLRPPKPDETRRSALVYVYLGQQINSREHSRRAMSVAIPILPPSPELQVTWSYSQLHVDGGNITPWRRKSAQADAESFPIRSALNRHFGERFPNDGAEPGDKPWDPALLPMAGSLPADPAVDCELLETQSRWDVVADLPLTKGAVRNLPDSRWSVEEMEILGYDQGSRSVARVKSVGVRVSRADLWLGSRPAANFNSPRTGDFACMINTADGRVYPLYELNLETGVSSIKSRTFPLSGNFKSPELSADLRLVVLRSQAVRRILHTWKTAGGLGKPTQAQKSIHFPKQTKPEESGLIGWLANHPVPPADASAPQVRAWSDTLLKLLGSYEKGFRKTRENPYPEELKSLLDRFVVIHPETALECMVQIGSPPGLLESAVERSLPRDAVKRFPQFATERVLVETYILNGWTEDLAEVARSETRRGRAWMVTPILLAVPRAVGLTKAEWIGFFRLNPSPEVYEALRGKVLPQEVIDHEVDQMVQHFRINSNRHLDLSPGLKLALARGRQEAPRWLHEDLAARIRNREISYYSITTVDPYFNFPESASGRSSGNVRERMVDWFLSIDPDRFVFDPVTRKYQLPNTP